MASVLGYSVDFMNELGRGAFGTVYKGFDSNGGVVAVKKVSITRRGSSSEAVKFNELKDKALHHRNLVKILDVKYFNRSIWIIMEFCEMGDLNDFFQNYSQLANNLPTKLSIMKHIASGVRFLHSKNIVHRDIKPGNILVQSEAGRQVVKLGDFGLVKILDPECITSGMSSDVGTFSFKAPEFFDETPNGKIHYHRNVDVYSSGLTFTAILQVQAGKNLKPRAEGSLQSSERRLVIGFAAHARAVRNQADFNVVEDKPSDNVTTRRVKKIIRKMTTVAAPSRISALDVAQSLDNLTRMADLAATSCRDVDSIPDAICFTSDHLLVRRYHPGLMKQTIRFFDPTNGKEAPQMGFICVCDHTLSTGGLFTYGNDAFLVEACANQHCMRVQLYDLKTHQAKTVLEGIMPYRVCLGPRGSLLVFDGMFLHLLNMHALDLRFHEVRLLGPFNWAVQGGMCYSSCYDTVVVVNNKQLCSVDLKSGDVIWQRAVLIDVIPLEPNDVCDSRDGWMFVANGNAVLAVDSSDGSILQKFTGSPNHGSIAKIASSGGTSRLAMWHQTPFCYITCLDVNYLDL